MERIYAFTDEYGAFGWDIDNPSVSTHFIITAILVEESKLSEYAEQAEKIRERYFQTGEMKSSKVPENKHARRMQILGDIVKLPIQFLAVCIDKRSCLENMSAPGLRYKPSFYKFMNNIIHRELRTAFSVLTIVADEIGSNDFKKSFCQYVASHQDEANLLGEADFVFQESGHDARIQVADFISGTLSKIYDTHRKSMHAQEYWDILSPIMTRVELYPKTYKTYNIEESALAEDYDVEIANLCFNRVAHFIEKEKDNMEPETRAQVIVAKYLLFRFMNNDTRGYIVTNELQRQLQNMELNNISERVFRTRIIGKLRDKGVIIASSNKGYKIPSKTSELRDFIEHDAKIVFPMLYRLKKCRDLVKLHTLNGLDLLDDTEFVQLKKYFDNLPDTATDEENEVSGNTAGTTE